MPSLPVILLIFVTTFPYAGATNGEIKVQPDRIAPPGSLSVTCYLPWQEDLQEKIVSVLGIELVKSKAQTGADNATLEPEVSLATVRIGGKEAALNVDNEEGRFEVNGSISSSNPLASVLQLNMSPTKPTDVGCYACKFSLLSSTFVVTTERAEANVSLAGSESSEALPWVMASELLENEKAENERQTELQASMEQLQQEFTLLTESNAKLEENEERLKEKIAELQARIEELEEELASETTAKLEASEKRLDEAESRLAGLSSRLEILENEYQNLSQAVESSVSRDQLVEEVLRVVGSQVESTQEQAPAGQEDDQSDKDAPPSSANIQLVGSPGGASPTTSDARRQCFVCGDASSKRPCNGTELRETKPVTCPEGLNFCMNDISQTESSNTIIKRCASEEQCKQKNSPACRNFAIFSAEIRECRFCCSSDACNVSFKPSIALVETED